MELALTHEQVTQWLDEINPRREPLDHGQIERLGNRLFEWWKQPYQFWRRVRSDQGEVRVPRRSRRRMRKC